MRTIRQFVAAVRRSGAPGDMEYQVNAWPYPQAGQSHIVFYRRSWPAEPFKLPARQICIGLVNSDLPGVLMRIRQGEEKSPKKVAQALWED